MNLERIKSTGELAKYTGFGSYPIGFIMRGMAVCHECACQIDHNRDDPDETDRIADSFVNWESRDLHCDLCSDIIESAYGNG